MEWSDLTRRTYEDGMDAVSVRGRPTMKREDCVGIFERGRLMKLRGMECL